VYVGNVPAGTKVLDAKVWVRRVEGLLPRYLKLNHPSLSVPREQCGPVIAEKGIGSVLVEFRAMRQVMIEAVDQPSSRERQMRLAFAMARTVVRSMLFKNGIKAQRGGVPIGMFR
jgi:hypothetical protein